MLFTMQVWHSESRTSHVIFTLKDDGWKRDERLQSLYMQFKDLKNFFFLCITIIKSFVIYLDSYFSYMQFKDLKNFFFLCITIIKSFVIYLDSYFSSSHFVWILIKYLKQGGTFFTLRYMCYIAFDCQFYINHIVLTQSNCHHH